MSVHYGRNTHNLVLNISKYMSEKFEKWKASFENKGMKAYLGKTKVMVSESKGGNTQE